VTYSLTARGMELQAVLQRMADLAIRWQQEDRA